MTTERTPQALNGDHTATASRPTPPPGEFSNRFRGKSPEEMLGIENRTSLVMPTILATVGSLALLAALTVVPYILAKSAPAPAPVEAATQQQNQAAPAPSPSPGNANAAALPNAGPTSQRAAAAVLDKLGETDVKPASPKVNPLDNKADDLLKDLK